MPAASALRAEKAIAERSRGAHPCVAQLASSSSRYGTAPAILAESCRMRSIRPLAEVDSTRAPGESTCREWRVGEFQGATRLHTLGRVGGRAVDSLTRLDPPPLASRPQPRSTRRREWAPAEGESTARH